MNHSPYDNPAGIRVFPTWDSYNAEVAPTLQYDPDRDPWPLAYFAEQGVENDQEPAAPDPLRVLFWPHGFGLGSDHHDARGNLLACGWAYQPPVLLLAADVPFVAVKWLVEARPETLGGVLALVEMNADD